MCSKLYEKQERMDWAIYNHAKPQQTQQNHHLVLMQIIIESWGNYFTLMGPNRWPHQKGGDKLGSKREQLQQKWEERHQNWAPGRSALQSRQLGQTDGGEEMWAENPMSLGPFQEQGKRCQPKERRDSSFGSGRTVWDCTPENCILPFFVKLIIE